jgi:excisionase family DNA binding protein
MTEAERKTPPPLSTRECAEFMGVSTDYIVKAIKAGELRAECARRPGARNVLYRVHEDEFIAWLRALGWSRLPKTGTG